jgi:hypothetical protein
LTGITSEEGIFKSVPILTNDKKKKLIATEWEKLLPLTFYYDHIHEDDIVEINVKIYDFYFKEKFMDVDDFIHFINVSKNLNKIFNYFSNFF